MGVAKATHRTVINFEGQNYASAFSNHKFIVEEDKGSTAKADLHKNQKALTM